MGFVSQGNTDICCDFAVSCQVLADVDGCWTRHLLASEAPLWAWVILEHMLFVGGSWHRGMFVARTGKKAIKYHFEVILSVGVFSLFQNLLLACQHGISGMTPALPCACDVQCRVDSCRL